MSPQGERSPSMGIPSSHRVHCGNLNKGKVSVVIPVRDEETTSDGCLASLRTRRHTDLEIMVVDDASTDRTVEIVQHHVDADPRVRLVRTDGPPPGWAGKVYAMCRASPRPPATGCSLLTPTPSPPPTSSVSCWPPLRAIAEL